MYKQLTIKINNFYEKQSSRWWASKKVVEWYFFSKQEERLYGEQSVLPKYVLERISKDQNEWYPLFRTTSPILQTSPFLWKNMNPPTFSEKLRKLKLRSTNKGGSNYDNVRHNCKEKRHIKNIKKRQQK